MRKEAFVPAKHWYKSVLLHFVIFRKILMSFTAVKATDSRRYTTPAGVMPYLAPVAPTCSHMV